MALVGYGVDFKVLPGLSTPDQSSIGRPVHVQLFLCGQEGHMSLGIGPPFDGPLVCIMGISLPYRLVPPNQTLGQVIVDDCVFPHECALTWVECGSVSRDGVHLQKLHPAASKKVLDLDIVARH